MGGLFSTYLRPDYLYKLFGTLWLKRFALSHIYIFIFFVFNNLFVLTLTHRYLFCTLGYNSILLYFLAQVVPALSTGSSFNWLPCPVDMPPLYRQWGVFKVYFQYGTTRWYRLILYISFPGLETQFSKDFWLLFRMLLETKN